VSEYDQDLFEDDLDFDPEEDLFEDEDDRAAEVSSIVADWERQTGVTLSDEEFNEMGIRVAVGISPDEAYAATDQGNREANFEDFLDRVETVEGRRLTDTEIDRLAQREELAELRGEDSLDPAEAIYDLSSSDDRAQYIGEMLEAPRERTEASAVQEGEDGDVPSYNLDDSAERVEAIDQMMAGADVATHDSTYDIESDE
jgi:hypothetical protein